VPGRHLTKLQTREPGSKRTQLDRVTVDDADEPASETSS